MQIVKHNADPVADASGVFCHLLTEKGDVSALRSEYIQYEADGCRLAGSVFADLAGDGAPRDTQCQRAQLETGIGFGDLSQFEYIMHFLPPVKDPAFHAVLRL